MMTWWFTTFMAPAIKQKVHNLPGVEYLYEVMPPDQLEIPAYITEYIEDPFDTVRIVGDSNLTMKIIHILFA